MNEHEIPMRLFHCVGEAQAWRLIFSSISVVVVYTMISLLRFLPAALAARTTVQRIVWWSITLIFPFCAVSGYATNIIAGWHPALAYPIQEWSAWFSVIFCMAFLVSTSRRHLQAVGDDEFRAEVARIVENYSPAEVLRQLKERL